LDSAVKQEERYR